MSAKERIASYRAGSLVLILSVAIAGCHTPAYCPNPDGQPVPRELQKQSLPTYVVEPPDILLIDVIRAVPRPPYKIQPLDTLIISATEVKPGEPITGTYSVDPDGKIDLGPSYGSIAVQGMTLEEARKAVQAQLIDAGFKQSEARVGLGQSRAQQLVRGEHLVRPDGTVGLGIYGNLHIAGMTLDEVKSAVEGALSQTLLDPEVAVDVYAYNSKVYYVITDGGGYGEQVYRFPVTGNETVLDGVSQIFGLPIVSDKHLIWVARPDPEEQNCCQRLPVDWKAITKCGDPRTNYQILPGDRIYVQAQCVIHIDTWLARFISPFERVLGITLLGSATVHEISTPLGSNGGGGGGF
jgi:polysaccharide export outer membrane protein